MALQEHEIFDCMSDNLKKARRHCRALATTPREGWHYSEYRAALKLVEGSCRQASAFREDTRWLDLAMKMEHAHQQAGEWLRGVQIEVEVPETPGPDGYMLPAHKIKRRLMIPKGKKHPLFMILGDLLEFMLKQVEITKNAATGKVGMILPERILKPQPRRAGAPVHFTTPKGMHKNASGLLVPDGAGAQ